MAAQKSGFYAIARGVALEPHNVSLQVLHDGLCGGGPAQPAGKNVLALHSNQLTLAVALVFHLAAVWQAGALQDAAVVKLVTRHAAEAALRQGQCGDLLGAQATLVVCVALALSGVVQCDEARALVFPSGGLWGSAGSILDGLLLDAAAQVVGIVGLVALGVTAVHHAVGRVEAAGSGAAVGADGGDHAAKIVRPLARAQLAAGRAGEGITPERVDHATGQTQRVVADLVALALVVGPAA